MLRTSPAIVGYPHEWEVAIRFESGTSPPDPAGEKERWILCAFSETPVTDTEDGRW